LPGRSGTTEHGAAGSGRQPAMVRAGAGPRLRVVGDAREPLTQFDDGRELALLVEGGTDRGGIGFGHHEHGQNMDHASRGRQAGHG